MSYTLFFTDDAREDILEGYKWYEEQREGLGEEFLDNLDATTDNIKEYPLHYQVQHKEQRAALLRRFPYKVIYFIDKEQVVVQAVIRMSRDPQIWQSRKG